MMAGDSKPTPPDPAGVNRFRHPAMATEFEIFIGDCDREYAAEAAGAAFEELDRLEQSLSRFVPSSDISRINGAPPGRTVRIGLDAFACLERCIELHAETGGAFDVTVGALVDCWRGRLSAARPTTEALTAARARMGLHRVRLRREDHTVTVRDGPVAIDLGGFGKGHAVDQMARVLRQWDVTAALLHGGHSTALGLRPPAGRPGWPVTIRDPVRHQTIRTFALCQRALSGSGVRKGKHIIDPRTGRPVVGQRAVWCAARGAGTADALSTALLVMSAAETSQFVAMHANIEAISWRAGA